MDYESFRHFADSWGLLYLVIVFCAAVLYAFRPGSRKIADEIAQIPFKEEDSHV
jgi:cytochrome c oxidase cbb3-type subunit 4